jgi:hypothetical protein
MIITQPVSSRDSHSFNSRKWIVNGASVRGISHSREHNLNQDSIYWIRSDDQNLGILSVADGHGSETHFRSKIGSKIATKIATRTLHKFFTEYPLNTTTFPGIRDIIRYSIPRLLVKNWNDEVSEHFQRHPFTSIELSKVSDKKNTSVLSNIISNPQIAYGSTLVTAVLTENYVLFFQIGDGNILIVDNYRNTASPFDKLDETGLGNQIVIPLDYTSSLCMNSSWLDFKVRIYPISDLKPKLILLTTDGYYNSFENESGFYKIGADYLDILNNYGLDHMQNNLKLMLKATSSKGSGDDITLGYLFEKDR